MTIEFQKTTETCQRAAPTFGCKGCIDKDREAAIRQFYIETPRPSCPDHGAMMIASGNRGSMSISYECEYEDCGAGEEVRVS